MRTKPKFHIGQVVRNCYFARDYQKIVKRKFCAGANDKGQWAYTFYFQGEFGTVWFEEKMLRALTKRERSTTDAQG